MSLRFRSSLYALGLPFIVSPTGGGLKPSAVVSDFFRDEGALHRLRRFDNLLLSSTLWMKPFDQSSHYEMAGSVRV